MVIGHPGTTTIGPRLYSPPHPTRWREDSSCTQLGFNQCLLFFNPLYIQSVSPIASPFLSSMTRFKVHLLPLLPSASLTPEQPPTELLTQGKLKKKSVLPTTRRFPLWKKLCLKSIFFLLWCRENHKLDKDLHQKGINTTLLELFSTIIYHSEIIS